MHFTIGGPPRGKEYKSYLIRNMEHFIVGWHHYDLPEIPQGRQCRAACQIDTPFPASKTKFALH